MVSDGSFDSDELEDQIWQNLEKLATDDVHQFLFSSESSTIYIAARILHMRGEQSTFDLAKQLCQSGDVNSRDIGAFLLGQLGTPDFPFAKKSAPLLSQLLLGDRDANVRAAAAAALGHLADSTTLDVLVESIHDEDAEVRRCIAAALGAFNNEKIIKPLIFLTRDINDEVRSWAVFSLRISEIDGFEIRNRLCELLSDSNDNLRNEAIIGLADRKDDRVFSTLFDELWNENVLFELIEAAGNLGDRRFLPRLKGLELEWKDDLPKALISAISKIEKDE